MKDAQFKRTQFISLLFKKKLTTANNAHVTRFAFNKAIMIKGQLKSQWDQNVLTFYWSLLQNYPDPYQKNLV